MWQERTNLHVHGHGRFTVILHIHVCCLVVHGTLCQFSHSSCSGCLPVKLKSVQTARCKNRLLTQAEHLLPDRKN